MKMLPHRCDCNSSRHLWATWNRDSWKNAVRRRCLSVPHVMVQKWRPAARLYGDEHVLNLAELCDEDCRTALDDSRPYKNNTRRVGKTLQLLIQRVNLLPVSSAECERGFSCMNMNDTAVRNRLAIDYEFNSRLCRFVPAAIQHDAIHFLRLQRRVSLRESQRQVLLAVDDRITPYDARHGIGHHPVHQQVRRVRLHGQHDRRSQPDNQRASVSARLAGSVDRVQLRHGESFSDVVSLPADIESNSSWIITYPEQWRSIVI